MKTWTRPNGLIIGQLRVPLGVIGIIYESRPDVTSEASGLCIKSGNAIILRGGSDAINSNMAIGNALRTALEETGLTKDIIQVVPVTERSYAEQLMKMREYIDVLIPRGGADLIKTVVEKSTVPVIETGTGNCHIYVEEDADLNQSSRHSNQRQVPETRNMQRRRKTHSPQECCKTVFAKSGFCS